MWWLIEERLQRYGYHDLLIKQLQLGVFGYCGAERASLDVIYDIEGAGFDAAQALSTRYD